MGGQARDARVRRGWWCLDQVGGKIEVEMEMRLDAGGGWR